MKSKILGKQTVQCSRVDPYHEHLSFVGFMVAPKRFFSVLVRELGYEWNELIVKTPDLVSHGNKTNVKHRKLISCRY